MYTLHYATTFRYILCFYRFILAYGWASLFHKMMIITKKTLARWDCNWVLATWSYQKNTSRTKSSGVSLGSHRPSGVLRMSARPVQKHGKNLWSTGARNGQTSQGLIPKFCKSFSTGLFELWGLGELLHISNDVRNHLPETNQMRMTCDACTSNWF